MSDFPNDAAVSRAVSAARGVLSPAEAAKLERLARNKSSLKNLTSGLSERDWNNIMRVMNNPELLRQVLSSPKGKSMLQDLLKRVN